LSRLAAKDQEIQTLQSELESRAKEVSDKVQELQQKQVREEVETVD
jgi:hypothetical protein